MCSRRSPRRRSSRHRCHRPCRIPPPPQPGSPSVPPFATSLRGRYTARGADRPAPPMGMVRRVSSSRHFRQKTGEEQRATWLELFFDLVFVFAVTQLSHLLLHHLTLHGALQTLFLLLVVWWAWIYTTWMTNWFDPESVLVLLVVMASSLLMAVAIPEAFGRLAPLFACSYVLLQVVRNGFNVYATPHDH